MADDERWGGDGLGPEDLAIPEVKLIQNVGGSLAKGQGAQPGDFYLSLTDEVIKGQEGFDMVIVGIQKSRTYWGRADILDDPPECASLDARGMRSINGDDCSQCEFRNEAPWLLNREERRKKCLINYNILGIKYNEALPILLRTTGISAVPAKELYTQLTINKQLKGGWYKAKTHVSSIKKTSAAGDAYAVRFGKLEPIEEKDLVDVKTQACQLLGTTIGLPEGRPEEEPAASEPTSEKKPDVTPVAKEPEKPPAIDTDF